MRTLSQLMNLEGRLAVITGGAGHLGRAMADALAELGCSVCLLDRNRSALQDAQEQLQARWQTPVATLEMILKQKVSERLSRLGSLKIESARTF